MLQGHLVGLALYLRCRSPRRCRGMFEDLPQTSQFYNKKHISHLNLSIHGLTILDKTRPHDVDTRRQAQGITFSTNHRIPSIRLSHTICRASLVLEECFTTLHRFPPEASRSHPAVCRRGDPAVCLRMGICRSSSTRCT